MVVAPHGLLGFSLFLRKSSLKTCGGRFEQRTHVHGSVRPLLHAVQLLFREMERTAECGDGEGIRYTREIYKDARFHARAFVLLPSDV